MLEDAHKRDSNDGVTRDNLKEIGLKTVSVYRIRNQEPGLLRFSSTLSIPTSSCLLPRASIPGAAHFAELEMS